MRIDKLIAIILVLLNGACVEVVYVNRSDWLSIKGSGCVGVGSLKTFAGAVQ